MPDKMIDLGRKIVPEVFSVPAKEQKHIKEYPTVWTRDVELPLSPDDIGKTFQISGVIHITGIEERLREETKNRKKEYSFELRSIQIHNERSKLKQVLKKNMR